MTIGLTVEYMKMGCDDSPTISVGKCKVSLDFI